MNMDEENNLMIPDFNTEKLMIFVEKMKISTIKYEIFIDDLDLIGKKFNLNDQIM